MQLTQKDLLRFFNPTFLQRGQYYFENKRVVELRVQNDARLIRASVKGSGNQQYSIRVHLKVRHGLIDNISGNCSCPVKFNCKHVAASLLYFINQQPLRGEIRFGGPADKWLYQSKAVKPLQSGPELTSQLLLYILNLKQETSGLKLYVECVKTRILNGGRYGEITPFCGDPESRARFIRDDDRLTLLLLKSLEEGYSK